MRQALLSAALPVALFAAAAPAPAQHAPAAAAPPVPQLQGPTLLAEPVALMIAAFDSDGDGRVTRAEFDNGVRHSFDVIDTAHRGSLSYIAFADWAERWLGDRSALPSPFEVDRDDDNRITPAELADRFDALFARFDTNRDGVLTRAELVTMHTPDPGQSRGRRGRR